MKIPSKVFVIVLTLFIVLPVGYLSFKEMRYRSTHPADAGKADTTLAPKTDTLHK